MNPDETLDKVIALWKKADEHSDQADLHEMAAANEQRMAEDLEDEAEALWKPLAKQHPEWFDALIGGKDPR